MTDPNSRRRRHYQKHVIQLPISEPEYFEILDHGKSFREWLSRMHATMPDLFPEGYERGFRLKDNSFSMFYGIRFRSIELHPPAKGLFVILPSFVKVDLGHDSRPKVYTPDEVIRFLLECESRKESLQETDFRRKHRGHYRLAVRVFGSWYLALETAGLSTRKAKSLCDRKVT